jgi:hypothetical protein
MEQFERNKLFRQVMWDYNIPVADIEALFAGKKKQAGHYSRITLFRKMLESYSWFTLLKIFTPEEIKIMLNNDVINGLRTPSLKNKYEFIRKRLQEVIPATG